MSDAAAISDLRHAQVQGGVAIRVAKLAQDAQTQVAEQLIATLEQLASVAEPGKGEQVDTHA